METKTKTAPGFTGQEQACERLREIFKPGDKVYTILRHVSKSGMMRRIDVMTLTEDGPRCWTHLVARATSYRHDFNKGGLVVHGCGMDMGFEVVYNLGRALWPNGDGQFVSHRNGSRSPEKDGGYMLRHEWI